MARPDPFEDIPAPPLRLVRPEPVAEAAPAQPPAEAAPAAAIGAKPKSARVLRMPREPRPAPAPEPARIEAAPVVEAAAASLPEPETPAPADQPVATAEPDLDASAEEVFGLPAESDGERAAPADRPAAAPLPRRHAVATLPSAPAHPASARHELRRAVLVGAAIAILIIIAAVLARPGADGAAAASDPAAPAVATALGSAPVPAGPTVTATPPSETLVRLRLGPGVSEPRRAALSGAVSAAGYGAVEVRDMPIPVQSSRIEFFSPEDRDAAEALGRALAPLTGALPEVRDLAGNAGGEPGRIEAWLAETAAD